MPKLGIPHQFHRTPTQSANKQSKQPPYGLALCCPYPISPWQFTTAAHPIQPNQITKHQAAAKKERNKEKDEEKKWPKHSTTVPSPLKQRRCQ
jgi:hypothetical protein